MILGNAHIPIALGVIGASEQGTCKAHKPFFKESVNKAELWEREKELWDVNKSNIWQRDQQTKSV